jgi:hypothetical protein
MEQWMPEPEPSFRITSKKSVILSEHEKSVILSEHSESKDLLFFLADRPA